MWLRAYLDAAILGGLAVCAPALLRQGAAPDAPAEVGLLEALGAQNLTYFWAGKGGSTYSPQRETKPSLGKRPWWIWRSPWGKYRSSPTGLAIDEHRNIYLTELNSVRKFSPNGVESWWYPRRLNEEFNNAPSLLDGRVFTSSNRGRVVALSMETGRELWSTKALKGEKADGTNGFVSAQEGVVLTRVGTTDSIRGRKSCCGDAGTHVVGLNATNGSVLWSFEPEVPVWNFLASFAGDGTFVFQDLEGRAYRARLSDGSIIWRSGGANGTWTDGSAMLGPNNLVYAVNTDSYGSAGPDGTGALSAYDLRDGRLRWQHDFGLPVNSQPLVGPLAAGGGAVVVMPVGGQPGYDYWCLYVLALTYAVFTARPMGLLFGPVLGVLYGCCRGRAWWCSRTAVPKFLACVLLVYALEYLRQVALHVQRFPVGMITAGPIAAQLWALDAGSGAARWSWDLPAMGRNMAAGGCELIFWSSLMGGPVRSSHPTPYGTGAIDADGVIYIPYQDGRIYAVDGGGAAAGPGAGVSAASVGAAFNMEGVALAPGVLAVTTIDGSLHVFRRGPPQAR